MTDTSAPPSVLLVDDRPENLLALEGVLAPLGLRLERATSGDEALRHLLRDEPALIILDVQMPGLDGFETARHIRGRPRTSAIPIIFLTAISHAPEHQLQGYDVGAVDYVAKPFDPDVLRAKVSVFVERSVLQRTVEGQRQLLAQRLEERDRAQAALAQRTAELERSNAELDRFAGAVSRALRDPLLTAAGFLDLLATDVEGQQAELTAGAVRGIDRTIEVLDALRRYADVTAEPQHHEPVDLDDVLEEVLAARAAVLDEIGALVRSDPLPTVLGDRWQLVHLVGELVDNAITFRSDLPLRIQVSVSRRGDRWVVTVRDNGAGVDPAELPRLFTVFSRPWAGGDRAGAGLGLATCRRIVERHGGDLWAESNPERGTSISFALPSGEAA